MIYVFMRGRLGNQLFQYAFVRVLQEYNPSQKVCYIFEDVINAGVVEDGWENSLKYFNVSGVDESEHVDIRLSILQRLILHFYWRKYPHKHSIESKHSYQIKWIKLLDKLGLYYLDLGYFPFTKKCNGNVIISGNFESELYFSEIKNKLLLEITPKLPLLDKNMRIMQLIKSKNSVCVSIRRGDFIDNPDFSKLLNVCTCKYFERAVLAIQELIPLPTFIFFSDDIEWVKRYVHVNGECYYEDGDDPVWEKLRLMSGCKHFIISNSSFSWWAQYLGQAPDKIVIAPERWYNSEYKPDIVQPNWKLIPVD